VFCSSIPLFDSRRTSCRRFRKLRVSHTLNALSARSPRRLARRRLARRRQPTRAAPPCAPPPAQRHLRLACAAPPAPRCLCRAACAAPPAPRCLCRAACAARRLCRTAARGSASRPAPPRTAPPRPAVRPCLRPAPPCEDITKCSLSIHSSLYRVPTGGLPLKAVHDYRLPFKTKVINWGSPRSLYAMVLCLPCCSKSIGQKPHSSELSNCKERPRDTPVWYK